MKLKSMLCGIVAVIATLVSAGAFAEHSEQHKVVNGVGIYLGVLPVAMIQDRPKAVTEAEMRHRAPPGKHQYHVSVSLFDNASGKRITDAKVTAHVYEINLAGKQKNLEPMLTAGLISYGNYFSLPQTDNPYRIRVRIERPGVRGVIEAQFEYQHPRA